MFNRLAGALETEIQTNVTSAICTLIPGPSVTVLKRLWFHPNLMKLIVIIISGIFF